LKSEFMSINGADINGVVINRTEVLRRSEFRLPYKVAEVDIGVGRRKNYPFIAILLMLILSNST